MDITLFHNPQCSKSRQTLQLLQEKNLIINTVEYLKEPPGKDLLRQILVLLDMQPRDLMRKNESVYKELNLESPALSNDALIDAMLNNPILIERPIVVVDNKKAAIGRPPENVLSIIES